MRKIHLIFTLILLSMIGGSCSTSETETEPKNKTIVELLGQLKVEGKNIVNKNGEIVTLRGMSLFWSQWGSVYYNEKTIGWLHDDWKCTIIRAAMGIENGGYLENKQLELAKLYRVIAACLDLGIYVIVDWHDHHAEEHLNEAVEFFGTVSSRYGEYPNLIYEIYNEPLDVSWSEVLKPYSESVIAEIRKHDPDNIIAVGTPNWSQDVEDVVEDPIEDDNVVYSLHFYTSTHRQWLRDKALIALAANIPLMATEWGLSESSGTGEIDQIESQRWINFLEQHNLSSCNWSVINKDESSAALLPSTTALFGWDEKELTQSGKMIRDYLISKNSEFFDKLD